MPKLSRYFIKSALICLAVGALLTGLVMGGANTLPSVLLALRPLALHLLTVGWATQLIFGVAFWMFPHFTKEQPRGDERLAWLAFLALDVGLVLRALGEPVAALRPGAFAAIMLPMAAVLQVAAMVLFGLVTWPRIKALNAAR